MSRRWFLVVPAAALAACGAEAPAPAAPAPRAVRVAAVSDTTARAAVVAAGQVAARDELSLAFKVGGVVQSIAVDEGDRVAAGQRLATLALPEIDAAVAKAEAALAKAERDAARLRRLHADSVATRAQLDDAETALTVARSDAESARFNRRHAVITAPAAGTVLRRLARPGEVVAPGAPVLVVASQGRGMVFRASVADRDLVRLAAGARAEVTLDAYPGRLFAATVLEKGMAAAPGTGAYQVTLALPGAGDLPSGLVGRARISASAGEPVRLVPVEALVEADGREGTVYALRGDSAVAERRRVTIAFVGDDAIGIAAGLEGVARVVTDGAAFLRDGEPVRVAP